MKTELTIAKLREINKTLSYVKIAKALGVSTQSVYRWLNGKSIPSPLALEKIQKLIK